MIRPLALLSCSFQAAASHARLSLTGVLATLECYSRGRGMGYLQNDRTSDDAARLSSADSAAQAHQHRQATLKAVSRLCLHEPRYMSLCVPDDRQLKSQHLGLLRSLDY